MKFFTLLILILPMLCFAQVKEVEQDSLLSKYILVEGDSIQKGAIGLDEVKLLHKLKFNSREDRRRYLIIRRKTIKVYPYAKLASERLDSMYKRLADIKKKRHRKKYTKRLQKYIEGEFSDELKKLTRTEGQILVKLIHRQTGKTAFELVKELRSGWKAFWYNNTASLFDISLKKEYDPMLVKEDYLIEDVLQRNFQSGRLESQDSALDLDFYDLTDKWLNNKEQPKQ